MSDNAMQHLDRVPIRLNITSRGMLIALTETGAVIRVAEQPRHGQTTLTIEVDGSHTLHLPARVIRSVPQSSGTIAQWEHHVAIEFLELPHRTSLALRHLIERTRRVSTYSLPLPSCN